MDVFYDLKDYENHYMINKLGQIKSKYTNKILKNCDDGNGYLIINLWKNRKPKRYYIHRLLALQFIPNPENYDFVDHFDKNPLNNNLENLRWITHSGNQRNKNKRNNCSSKYIGVSWYKRDKKWRADIKIEGKKKHLGYFETEEEAHLIYEKKRNELMNVY